MAKAGGKIVLPVVKEVAKKVEAPKATEKKAEAKKK
jgi:hypothetical protein